MLKKLLVLWFSLASFTLYAEDQNSARLLVHLLDYLAKDYGGAVSEDGKVLSESEYAEQVEFAATVLKTSLEIPALESRADIKDGVKSLHDTIARKGAPAEVIPLARKMQGLVIEVTHLQMAPNRWPNLDAAAQLFATHCALCHGATGAGDGPAGVALDPKPANFLDFEAMDIAAPAGEFNTIRLGVPGTGMTPFPQFSDEDTWSLAFYVLSLRHPKPSADVAIDFNPSLLIKSATLSDIHLAQDLGFDLKDNGGKLAAIRHHQVTEEKLNTLDLARSYLKDAEELYKKGEFGPARERALRSYLEGIEPVEPRLKAQDPQLIVKLEGVMGAVRQAIEQKHPEAELQEKIQAALVQIDAADASLKTKGIDNRVAFVAAAGILLREGFEAALVILSLLSVIRAIGAKRAARWVHAGWITALALGVVCWFAVGVVFDVSGAQRELMEGLTSLVAVLILIGVGFWMHRTSEIGRWTKFIKDKVKSAIDAKNLIGLATISFLAVFREALESVLFLRIIWFDADAAAKSSMLSGIVITLIFIMICCWAAVKYSTKLPVTQLFKISAYIMAALAFILTGKGVHALQESGLVGVTQLAPSLRLDLLGIFPTAQTFGTQAVVLLVIGILWFQGKKPSVA